MYSILKKGVPALILTALMACAPEGEDRFVQSAPGAEACAAADTALADGINDGDEILLAFECLNKAGDFDIMLPVLEAMNVATDPSGTPLLDIWVSAINQALTQAEGGSVTVALNPDDIAAAVGSLLGFFESDAPDVALDLTAEAIDSGTLTQLMAVSGNIMQATADLKSGPSGADLNAWLGSLQNILCHDYDDGSACRSSLTRALSGASQVDGGEVTPYDPEDPTNDDLRKMVAWLMYAGGDLTRAEEANRGLARGLVAMAEPIDSLHYGSRPSLLETTTASLLPSLYGDDLSTDAYEGYPTRDAGQSALYGILEALNDPAVIEAMGNTTAETRALVDKYYVGAPGINGNGVPRHHDLWQSPSDKPDTYGVANTGLEQIVRMTVATNVHYDGADTPEACSGAFEILIPLVSPYMELSGSTSLSVIIMELYTQVPLPVAQLFTTMINNQLVVSLTNSLCGTTLLYDDTEALEMAIYSEETMKMAIPLLSALNHTEKLEEIADLLDDTWNTSMLYDMAPTLRLAFDAAAPTLGTGEATTPESSPYLPNPDTPAGTVTAHELVTEPLLAAIMDISKQGPDFMVPVANGLMTSEDALYGLFMSIGRMANNPDSALGDINLLLSEAAMLSAGGEGGVVDLSTAAGALAQEDLAYILFLTLGSEEVQYALSYGSGSGEPSLLSQTSTLIHNGSLSAYLTLFEALLLELDATTEASEQETSAAN